MGMGDEGRNNSEFGMRNSELKFVGVMGDEGRGNSECGMRNSELKFVIMDIIQFRIPNS